VSARRSSNWLIDPVRAKRSILVQVKHAGSDEMIRAVSLTIRSMLGVLFAATSSSQREEQFHLARATAAIKSADPPGKTTR
jgi:hypothetical protein